MNLLNQFAILPLLGISVIMLTFFGLNRRGRFKSSNQLGNRDQKNDINNEIPCQIQGHLIPTLLMDSWNKYRRKF